MAPAKPALRSRKRQTRLQFQSLSTSSPDKPLYHSTIQDRLAHVRYEGAKTNSSHKSGKQKDNDGLLTPEPSSQPQRPGRRSTSPSYEASSPPLQLKPQFPYLDSGEDDDQDLITPLSKRRKVSPTYQNDTKLDETPTRRSARNRNQGSAPRSAEDTISTTRSKISQQSAAIRVSSESIGSPETSGDEEIVLISKATTRRKNLKTKLEDPFVVDDYRVDEASPDRPVRSKAKGRTNRNSSPFDFIAGEDEIEFISSEDEGKAQPHSAQRKRSQHRRRSKREQEELDDDLKDLQDSSQEEDSAKRRRTRGGPVTSKRDEQRQHLNLLRKQRAGRKVPRLSDSDDEDDVDHSDGANIEDIAKSPILIADDDYHENLDVSTEDQVKESTAFHDAEDEDDFIIDDSEDQPLGRPHPDMPLAFTSYASRKPKELFIHVVEWLVKNKIAPAFSRDDELFQLSWDRVNDQVKAQAGSRLISSAWHAEFKNVILARPHMDVTMVAEQGDESFMNCDACNKSNHPARYEFKFSGQAYIQDTLEPVEFSDNEDGDDENEDRISYDQEGHTLAPQSTQFYLGRFCAANAEMGHKLTHWKHHLNDSLLEYLEEQGVLSAEAIVARERMNKKKREKEAEAIVDSMAATGMIAQLWQDLQDDLDDARYGMEGHEAKGGRRNTVRIGKVRMNQSHAKQRQ